MLTPFETEVLSRVAEDYESAHTITDDIARDLKRSVSEAEVHAALLNLAHLDLVQAYVYEANEHRYRAISAQEAKETRGPWFTSRLHREFDVTRERIRDIEKRALKKLRGDKS